MKQRTLLLIFFITLLGSSFPLIGQTFTHGVFDNGSSNQYFTSVSTLSNGNVVAALTTNSESIGVKLPPGHGFHIDHSGNKSVICFNNALTEVNWFVTSIENEYFEIDELVTDEYDNTYVLFTGHLSSPFVLNGVTLEEDLHFKTIVVKIDKHGEIEWSRSLEGTSFYEDDKMKIGNGNVHIILPFTEDITNPLTDSPLELVGSRDYYVTQLEYDNEVADVLHLYSEIGYLTIRNYTVSKSGKYAFAIETNLNFIINGVNHYLPIEFGNDYRIFEVSNDGSELYNSVRCRASNIELIFNEDERLVVAGVVGAVPTTPFIGSTLIVTASAKIFLCELNDEFEVEWIRIFTRETPGDSELKLKDLKKDCGDNYFLCGRSGNLIQFGDFTFFESATWANNWGDAFVLQTDSYGEVQWLKYGGGEVFRDEISEIALDNSGTVFCAGNYMTECSFDGVNLVSAGSGMHTEAMLLRLTNGTDEFSNLSITEEITNEFIGNDGAIDITVTGGSSEVTFDWNNDEIDDFDDTEDLSDLSAGFYTVIVKDTNNCTATGTYEIVSFVNLAENHLDTYDIYPNPTHDVINISGIDLNHPETAIQIIDVNGKVCFSTNRPQENQTINVKQLQNGVYYLRIAQSDKVETIRFVKR